MLLLGAVLTGCQANGSTTLPHVDFEGHRYFVDIADDDESRAMGLMFVDEMDENRGMFFIFPRVAPRSFWMRNTRIPLDIIYLDSDLRVVSIADAIPCRTQRCPSYPSDGPAQFVLELNAGQAEAIGLGPGDQVQVGNINLP
ncbi:MAG: DUF192 domain-containing protein [Pseudomonadota bacterium]